MSKQSRGGWKSLLFGWSNSVWCGIAVLIALFVYSSLGSAIPPLRQHPSLEMTEMEWFHWWPFKVLIALLCINISVVTIRQIPFRAINAGVLMIHTGIIVLALGSVYYFSTKVEGDVPVFRRRVVIRTPGAQAPSSMVVRPGNHVMVSDDAGEYHFSVGQIFPEWTIASGADAGKTAMMTWVDVVTPTQRFTRQLLDGYPQYTEDILPDRTRAKKTLGKLLVDESLSLTLDYEPQTAFYVMDSAAVYARAVGDTKWIERPIVGLPHYHERITSPDDVYLPERGEAFPLRPIDLAVPAVDGADPLVGYDVRVTAFLRYAFMATIWRDHGERLNPVADVTLSVPARGDRADYQLVAFDPRGRSAERGDLVFRWVDSPDAVDRLAQSAKGSLFLRVPESKAELTVAVPADLAGSDEDAFTDIEDTPYAYRLRNVFHDLPVRSGEVAGVTVSVVTLEIRTPDETITRFVTDRPDATRDLTGDGHTADPDPRFETSYAPGLRAAVTIVSGPGTTGTHVLTPAGGGIKRVPLTVGATVPIHDGLLLTLRSLWTHGFEDTRPRVVPRSQRDRNAREQFSMIRVRLSRGDWLHEQWLEYHRYPLESEQYAVPRRTFYNPSTLRLADGRIVELMFSRERHPLPTPIALETFELATHTGGYTGETNTIRDFISQLRFRTDKGTSRSKGEGPESAVGWSELVQMSSNYPASWGGFWYFQSEWDPPGQGYAGMNYTGLGVGNRNGVHIQLAGTCIAVLGMIYAFYYKPILRRRIRAVQQQRAAGGRASDDEDRQTAAQPDEPVALGAV